MDFIDHLPAFRCRTQSMLRLSRLLAAALAATTLTVAFCADARVVSSSMEMRFAVVATCSVSVANAVRVNVDCASPATPFQLNTAPAQSLQLAGPDAGRVTVYF
jgi:hypothetical protein